METAKVDIRKLQVLNDRIAQTIDALNQVRLSVHGISHTNAINPLVNPFAAQTAYNPVYGSPFAAGLTPGFGHTTGVGYNPFAAQVLAQQVAQQAAFGQNPLAQIWGQQMNPYYATNGLGHTTGMNPLTNDISERAYDPFWTQRVSQTFPFAQWGYSPFVQSMF
jgi:hypothetical protein